MIDHTDCDHERTSSARAKCRRARGGGGEAREKKGGSRATPKKEWGGKTHHDPDRERNSGQVPGRRDLECHVCHVERIVCRGTDPTTGMLLFVGERCAWRVESSDDFKVIQA